MNEYESGFNPTGNHEFREQVFRLTQNLADIEQRICDWLVINFEPKLKDHFLADLSWASDSARPQAISNFFTKRIGKRVFDILPDDIKNYILANSL